MLSDLHSVYTSVRDSFSAEQVQEIADQQKQLKERQHQLRSGWEQDQSGPGSESKSSGDEAFGVRYHGGIPPPPPGDQAGPSNHMQQLLGEDEGQQQVARDPTATPVAAAADLPPSQTAVAVQEAQESLGVEVPCVVPAPGATVQQGLTVR